MADRGSIEAGRGHITMGVDKAPLEKGMQQSKTIVEGYAAKITAISTAVLAASELFSRASQITEPFLKGLNVFAEWGSEARNTMRQTGIDFENLDMLMDGMRVSGEQFTPAIGHMSQFLVHAAEGGQQATEALNDMGVTLDELLSANQGERVMMLANGIAGIADASQRVAMQRTVFGRGGLVLNIEGGEAGIRARAARADVVEGVQPTAMLQTAAQYNESLREMHQAMNGLWMSLGNAAAPDRKSVV